MTDFKLQVDKVISPACCVRCKTIHDYHPSLMEVALLIAVSLSIVLIPPPGLILNIRQMAASPKTLIYVAFDFTIVRCKYP